LMESQPGSTAGDQAKQLVISQGSTPKESTRQHRSRLHTFSTGPSSS
jgi:hypothetical protein